MQSPRIITPLPVRWLACGSLSLHTDRVTILLYPSQLGEVLTGIMWRARRSLRW